MPSPAGNLMAAFGRFPFQTFQMDPEPYPHCSTRAYMHRGAHGRVVAWGAVVGEVLVRACGVGAVPRTSSTLTPPCVRGLRRRRACLALRSRVVSAPRVVLSCTGRCLTQVDRGIARE